MTSNLAAIILAGGASRRMGQDKAWLPWGPHTLLQHLVQSLHPALSPLIVVGGYRQTLPSLPAFTQVIHDTSPYPGPLHGLSLALEALQTEKPILVTGCDYPLLQPTLASFLAEHLEGNDAAVLEWQGEVQPLPGLYRKSLQATAQQLLIQGKRSLHALLDEAKHTVVPESAWRAFDEHAHMLCNINTPEEYQAAWQVFTSWAASNPLTHPTGSVASPALRPASTRAN